MRYFKYIDIDNYQTIKEKSIKFVSDRYPNNGQSSFRQFDWNTYVEYCPEILIAFTKYDLIPYTGYIYSIYDQDSSPLHLDYISDIHNKCRINIPIFNCEYSKTFYYRKLINNLEVDRVIQQDIMTDPNNKSNSKFINYIKFDENDPMLEKVDEVVVDRPTIIRVQEPHRVMVDSNHIPRVVLTIHTYKDPVYLLEDETS